MRRISTFYLCVAFFLLFSVCESTVEAAVVPVNLRTEYLCEPIGIDTQSPRFTWEYEGEEKDFLPARSEIRIGTSADMLSPYAEGMRLEPHVRYYWNVTVWNARGEQSATSATASFETGKFIAADWSGQWITDRHDKEYEPSPLFRKSFAAGKEIKEARAYIAAAGYYELFINGKRVGENYLDPGYTHFDKRILYVAHDVTPLLKRGDNVLAAVLGNGWYNEQTVAVWNFHEASWRSRPALLCELRLTYADGTSDVIATDPSWRTATGAYTYNNLYSGDKYDANLEEAGWKTVGFNDRKWQPATEAESPTGLLVAQQMPAIRITEELKPTAVKAFDNKNYLFTFDKNISGVCRLKVRGDAGTRIILKHGERLADNGHLKQEPINEFFRPVKAEEMFQTDIFTLKGTGEEVFVPSFTYHGFQYVEVECSKPVALAADNLTALFMHTAVNPVGRFACSNPTLNKIWDATMNAYLSNLHSIPTDCPQREKNGWTADAHIAIDLALLGFDGITVYEKWMNDFIDNQRDSVGDISGIVPCYNWGYGTGPVWDAALFVIPNALYDYYGDSRCIETLYPTMLRYLQYLETREKEGLLDYGLGDWVPWKATTNNEYTSSAYYYLDYTLMARFASLLGKDPAPYRQKAAELKQLINRKFFCEEANTYAEGTQAAQGVALYLGLVAEGKEQAVADKLHELVEANNYFLDFGMLGSKMVPAMLAKYGYIADVMKMITKTEAPSWGHWVETMNYKTLPEDWGSKSSLNHVFLGDISAWMMNWLAGIRHNSEAPGFSRIHIAPTFVKEIDWAKGEYHSVKGSISSEWRREANGIALSVTIPIGTEATVKAGNQTYEVKGGTHRFFVAESGVAESASKPAVWTARWIALQEDPYPDSTLTHPAPYFRKTIAAAKPIKKATAYVCGLGFYEMYINGQKIGDQVLAPAVTNYDRRAIKNILYQYDDQSTQRVFYNTFDVTGALREGQNTVGALLGNGWYNQRDRTVEGCLWYDTPRLLLQLEIEYADGTTDRVGTDESWKCRTGPLLHDAIFSGEAYDARLDLGMWNTNDYDDSAWPSSLVVRAPEGVLRPQTAPFDRITRTLKPSFEGRINDSTYLYRLPEMVSGWAELSVRGEAGSRIKLRFVGEEEADFGQFDTYTLSGKGVERWEPRFTWHTFRRVEVVTRDVEMNSESLTVKVVHTDVPQTGHFECSNELFNKVNEAYLRTQKANFHGSISSDCPHRERLAYTGDAQVVVESSIFSFDMTEFYRKWFDDMEDARNKNTGYVPHTAPFAGGGGGPAWGSAYVIMPWTYYCYYGDKTILEQHYQGMSQWVEYLSTRTDNRGIVVREEPNGWCLGDWCTPQNVEMPESLVNTAYYYHCASLMAKVADALGKKDDRASFIKLSEQIKSDFNAAFFNPATAHYWEGRQGADVFPLAFGLVPEENKKAVVAALTTHLQSIDHHFDTGILATPLLLQVLTDNGHVDLAYKLMDQRTEPGFGYLLNPNYSCLWERWDGKESRCHPMFGSVVAWFYKTLGGITLDTPTSASPASSLAAPHIRISPHPVGGLTYCKTSYSSAYGIIRSDWRINNGVFELTVEIPAHTTATVQLPCGQTTRITRPGIYHFTGKPRN